MPVKVEQHRSQDLRPLVTKVKLPGQQLMRCELVSDTLPPLQTSLLRLQLCGQRQPVDLLSAGV